EGQLPRLRPLRVEDFPALFAVAADPLIWEQHPARDRYKEEVFKRFFAKRWSRAERWSPPIARMARSSDHPDSTHTTKERARSKLGGRLWRGRTGAGSITER